MKRIINCFLILLMLTVFGCYYDYISYKSKDESGKTDYEEPDPGINPFLSDERYEWVLSQFDLIDEQVKWKGNINDDFTDDKVIVVLKRPINYIELDETYFGLENVKRIEYTFGPMPPDYFFKPEYKESLERFRQIIIIYLEPAGKSKIIQTIRLLEQLLFIKTVSPDNLINPT